MNEHNLPPFYVGQKVVALRTSDFGGVIKDKTYTVECCFVTKCCKVWKVGIAETTATEDVSICNTCGKDVNHKGSFVLIGDAKYFAPIQTDFIAITFEKVIEQERELINVN
jgi:hypothetical protein